MKTVRIYGDSVPLCRYGYVSNEERYISIVTDAINAKLCDRCLGSQTIELAYFNYYSDKVYFGKTADILIVHIGLVDCAPRPIPDNVRNFISRIPAKYRHLIVNFIHNYRNTLQNVHTYYKTPIPRFEFFYNKIVSESCADFRLVMLMTIAPITSDIESHSKGFNQAIERYNEIIRMHAKNHKNVILIDVHRLFFMGRLKKCQ